MARSADPYRWTGPFGVLDATDSKQHERLSDREFQVLCLIAAGKPPRDIGAELNVSVKTVATHRARLLAKMGLKNNAEVVAYSIEHIRTMQPAARLIVLTGYSSPDLARSATDGKIAAVLTKPQSVPFLCQFLVGMPQDSIETSIKG